MRNRFFLLLITFACGCNSYVSSTQVSNNELFDNTQKTQEQKEIAGTTTCGGENYILTVITKGEKRNLEISNSQKTIKTLSISYLSEPYVSLDSVKTSEKGFVFSIEYGSRLYYAKQFKFVCRQKTFYLDKIKVNSFDKADPETSWKKCTKIITPILPLERFSLTDYLSN